MGTKIKLEIKPGVTAEIHQISCPKCGAPGKKYIIAWGNGTKAAVEPVYTCDCWRVKD